MLEYALVPDLCGCRGNVEGLDCKFQRTTAARRDRKQGADHGRKMGGRHKPVTLSNAGKHSPWRSKVGGGSNEKWDLGMAG